jgi:outer membrane protein TolC
VAELKYPELSDGEVVETALSGRLDLANSADAVIDAQRQVYVAADGLRAGANLVGNVDVVSGGRASRQTLKAKENYSADLELDLPLDRVAEQNVYRKALITLSQKQREYELLSDTVAVEVRQAHRDLVEAAQRYGTHLEALKVAEKRFKDTFLLMQYGRASSRRVVSSLQDLRDAKDGATQALVNYTVATLNFYRDTEVLQVRPDGMWEKIAGGISVARSVEAGDSAVKSKDQ